MQKRSFIFRVKKSMKNFGLLDPEDKAVLFFDASVVTHHSPQDVKLQHWPLWTLLVGRPFSTCEAGSVSIPHICCEFSREARSHAEAYRLRIGWVPGLMRPGCASTAHFRVQCQY